MGTMEFYANGVTRPQPDCKLIDNPLSKTDLCSHQRSVELYAKSKYHPKEFIAVQCPCYIDYYENKCKGKTCRLTLDMLHRMYTDYFISIQELYNKTYSLLHLKFLYYTVKFLDPVVNPIKNFLFGERRRNSFKPEVTNVFFDLSIIGGKLKAGPQRPAGQMGL